MKTVTYTLGCGDRFGQQGEAQLAAYVEAAERGIDVSPVWNKSHREHLTVHTVPSSVRVEADAAVAALKWNKPYFVDADHISLKTVDDFIEGADFFTLDVADSIGTTADRKSIDDFVAVMAGFTGDIELPGGGETLRVSIDDLRAIAGNYLFAVKEAGRIYRHIAERKEGAFQVEVSMDETDDPQTPVELLFILAMIAAEKIPLDTIAPKFSGRFNKGVNYVGDVKQFAKEFELDVAVLELAVKKFGLKAGPRLSVHSGSDKFSIYPVMNRIIKKHGVGLHVKTAGTSWLEEVIGLAEADGDGLEVAKRIYAIALGRYDELAAPYSTVLDINTDKLPSVEEVNTWSSADYVSALRHDLDCPSYNADFRQLIHVAYKVAYELGTEYTEALSRHRDVVAKNVKYNLLERHIMPIFGPVDTCAGV